MVDINLDIKIVSAIAFILITIVFSIIAIICTRVLSNNVTRLTIYHNNEKYRIVNLYMTYLLLIFPSTVALYFILSGMTINIEYNPELLFISIQISFFVHLVCRVASLAKRPFPYYCKKCIDGKSNGWDLTEKLLKTPELCSIDKCDKKDEGKQVWNASRERIASFTYSLLCSIFLFIFVLLLTYISRMLMIYISEANTIGNILVSFEIPTFHMSLIILYFLFIPFLMAIIGEQMIKMFGGVPDFLIINK